MKNRIRNHLRLIQGFLALVTLLALPKTSTAQTADGGTSTISVGHTGALQTLAIPVHANAAGEDVMNAPSSGMLGRSGHTDLSVRVFHSCYPGQIRHTGGNMLSPNADLTMTMTLNFNGKLIPIKATYPSIIAADGGLAHSDAVVPLPAAEYSIPGGGLAGFFGNLVQYEVPIATKLALNPDGSPVLGGSNPVTIQDYSFMQKIDSCVADASKYSTKYFLPTYSPAYPCGSHMGKDGEVVTVLKGVNVAPDQSSIEIYVAFPGQPLFCGGRFSPIMMFFDEGRPMFRNQSDFLLNQTGRTHWPEANAPGYFLAYDPSGKGKITQGEQLFGNDAQFKNGFDKLAQYDSNQDGLISKKDKVFSQLFLWNDRNGDGIAQKSEVIPARKMLTKISLNYMRKHLLSGPYADEREKSVFWYERKNPKTKKMQLVTGEAIDVWFKASKPTLARK